MPPGRYLAMSGDIFACLKLGRGGIQWVESRGAARHPTMQDSPTTKNYPVQSVSSAEVEKPRPNKIRC